MGAGINEDDLDKQFFQKHMSQDDLKKLKLNKGEKRALKFILKRTGGLEAGQAIDLKKLTKNGDIAELKAMLAQETKKHNDKVNQGKTEKHKNFIATGTT